MKHFVGSGVWLLAAERFGFPALSLRGAPLFSSFGLSVE
jgi:hypothetical protein